MKVTESVAGQKIDVDKRPSIQRDDIERHVALFQRDVLWLTARNPDALQEICATHGVVRESIDELAEGLVDHFRHETHYRRRNKLRAKVTQNINPKKS